MRAPLIRDEASVGAGLGVAYKSANELERKGNPRTSEATAT